MGYSSPLHRNEVREVSGNPDPEHISTSYIERQNWTVRTKMRHYTRLSNGFAYNFIQIHSTLRTSPAMAAGVTDRLWVYKT